MTFIERCRQDVREVKYIKYDTIRQYNYKE